MRSKTTHSEEETFAFGTQLAAQLTPGSILCLKGDLGAGKTALIRGIVSHFLPEEKVTSPTFSYLHSYSDSIHHFDLYRLKSQEEFLSRGFSDYFSQKNLCLIEWPEIIAPLLPSNAVTLSIKYTGQHSRIIEVS